MRRRPRCVCHGLRRARVSPGPSVTTTKACDTHHIYLRVWSDKKWAVWGAAHRTHHLYGNGGAADTQVEEAERPRRPPSNGARTRTLVGSEAKRLGRYQRDGPSVCRRGLGWSTIVVGVSVAEHMCACASSSPTALTSRTWSERTVHWLPLARMPTYPARGHTFGSGPG